MQEGSWTLRRANDLRLDSVAKTAAEAVKACGSHVDATERFLRRFMDHLDHGTTNDGAGPLPGSVRSVVRSPR